MTGIAHIHERVDQVILDGDPYPERHLVCDAQSARWAFKLGAGTPNQHGGNSRIRLCPFRPGTPHFHYWGTGHHGIPFQYLPDEQVAS